MNAKRLIEILSLKPLSFEGGFFRETYRSPETLETPFGRRNLSTAIYYLLSEGEKSRLHRLRSDEVFHFYFGDTVEMFLFHEDGTSARKLLGPSADKGEEPHIVVPRGCWQGAKLKAGGKFALMGTTVSPGFDERDFETGIRGELVAAFPGNEETINLLT